MTVSLVHVLYMMGNKKIPVGCLAARERQIFFEYEPNFIKFGLDLSPFKLPLKSGVITSEDRVFDGLFGLFNDSLPDGWGRLLQDRKLMKLGLNPNNISPLDRLSYVGEHGMGALVYEPDAGSNPPSNFRDLDEVAGEVLQFQEKDDERFIDDLLTLNGSSAGARPKILAKIDGEDWIIKFNSSFDPRDMGAIEYAYHLMAIEAGLDVPEARLFLSGKSAGYFGVKRFDRKMDSRVHMHSISGLLHADHRLPNLDYETIMRATLQLTKSTSECKKQFRAAIFNIFSHNHDDHAKNFAYLMDEGSKWTVSPAYDLTFSGGPNGEHCTTIMGEGLNPTSYHLWQLAEICAIKKQDALRIIDEVRSAVLKWGQFASDAGVSASSKKMIQTALERVAKNLS